MKKLKEEIRNVLQNLYSPREIQSIQRLLLTSWLAISDLDYYCDKDTKLSAQQREVFDEMLYRLGNSEPIQYVLGYTYFCGHRLTVNKKVLIPRPETEELVSLIERDITQNRDSEKDLKILDIGTGSGAIAIALAARFPQAQLSALDISDSALVLAKKNAQSCAVEVDFYKQDILAGKLDSQNYGLFSKWDIIVSNPPYIGNKEQLDDNVVKYEPHLALFVEENDPLLFYRKIGNHSKELLSKGGKLFFEINQRYGSDTKLLLEEMGYCHVSLVKDLFDNDRMIIAQKG